MGEMWHQELLSIEDARRCARFAQEAGCYAQCYYGDHFYYAGTEEWARSYAAASLLTGSEVKDLPAFIDRPHAQNTDYGGAGAGGRSCCPGRGNSLRMWQQ